MSVRVSSSGGSQRQEAADTRAALISGAIAALREVGFAGASSRQIAKRARCNQALIFYHFGSLADLLVAALEDVSAQRMDAYRGLLDRTGTIAELVDCARSILIEDLDAGHVTVLLEMIVGAQSVPGLSERVSACLAPWREIAETAVSRGLASAPAGSRLPARELAHGVVAGILGLELLANLDGDRTEALALFDWARRPAMVVDRVGRLRRRRNRNELSHAPGAGTGIRKMQEQITTDAVTGAFSYSGAAIARELLAAGHQVRTLTGHPERRPADTDVEVYPLDFDDSNQLRRSLRGVATLYNTYWVRFAHGPVDHQVAVANSRKLFDAAAEAGVRRIVHVSITHASSSSPYPYFSGKGEVEEYLAGTGIPSAILRPAVLFGGDGVLVNNIAWLLRRFPVFPVGGRGEYRLRAIHVDDLARLCVEMGGRDDTATLDAVGPQSLTFRQMVAAIRAAVGSKAAILPVPGSLIPALSAVLGMALRDTLLTRDEYKAMAAGLADSSAPSTGRVAFTDWLTEHGAELGRRYANELDLHFRQVMTA